MELKIIIVCAECKQHIGTVLKAENQESIEALLKLVGDRKIEPASIETIELAVPTQNAGIVDRPTTPTLRAATIGSGQYVMAVTMLRGRIDLASFEDEFLHSDAVHTLMAKVRVVGSAELDNHFPKYWAGRVTLAQTDGHSFAHEVIIPKGESGNPMAAQDVEEKFLGLAGPVIGEGNAKLVVEQIEKLETLDSVAPLLASLVIAN